jgi:hypothetical protein
MEEVRKFNEFSSLLLIDDGQDFGIVPPVSGI